jgi:hypothetical protein
MKKKAVDRIQNTEYRRQETEDAEDGIMEYWNVGIMGRRGRQKTEGELRNTGILKCWNNGKSEQGY